MKTTLILLNVLIVSILNAGNPIEEARSKHKNAEAENRKKQLIQTLANSERYYTNELKVLEEKILTAGEKIDSLETMIFNQICEEITIYKDEILNMSKDISNIDTIYSMFKIANNNK